MAGPKQSKLPVKKGCRIRLASPSDAQDILDIYAPYILQTAISFELTIPEVDDIARRIEDYTRQFPWLVMEKNGTLAGYAYAGSHRIRQAYQWNAETSIYLAEEFKGLGIGRALYQALLTILEEQGYQNLLAGIVLPNPASVSFHEKMGFTYLGTYHRVGYKFDRWHDVGWWEKFIGDPNNQPPAIVPFPEWVHNDALFRIFADALEVIK